jgi:phosphate uptake regulator
MVVMEARKLQRVGASFLISVPKRWVKSHTLDKGSTILVHERADGMLIIDPGLAEEPVRRRNVISAPENAPRNILAAYLAGYDVIEVNLGNAMTPALKREIKSMALFLVGVEIIEEDAAKMTLQCLIPRTIDLRTYLQRTYGIAAKMHEDAIRAFIRKDSELAQDVINRDREVDRLYFLVVRQLRRAIASPAGDLLLSPLNLLDYRLVAKEVEAIADSGATIAEQIVSDPNSPRPPQQFVKLLRELSHQVLLAHRQAIAAVLQQETGLARNVIGQKDAVTKLVHRLTEILAHADTVSLALFNRVVHHLERIFESSVDIADLVI